MSPDILDEVCGYMSLKYPLANLDIGGYGPPWVSWGW